ncbi:unnamed protein product [Xylocopa violacea]|uniref:Cytochrome c biogenesis B n=1 Tax=Xylocopa violacea TaxID=135666 RepID=A0ABP1NQZ3_XYLVO
MSQLKVGRRSYRIVSADWKLFPSAIFRSPSVRFSAIEWFLFPFMLEYDPESLGDPVNVSSSDSYPSADHGAILSRVSSIEGFPFLEVPVGFSRDQPSIFQFGIRSFTPSLSCILSSLSLSLSLSHHLNAISVNTPRNLSRSFARPFAHIYNILRDFLDFSSFFFY